MILLLALAIDLSSGKIPAGDHVLTEPLVIDSRHNGLTIAAKGARLIGGVRITGWKRYRGAIMVAKLPAVAAPLQSRGFSRATTPSHSELFFGGERMTLARWPNRGEFARIASTADPAPPDDGHGRPLGRIEYGFHYDGDRPGRWADPTNVWVHGYWAWDWAETYERIASLDTAKRHIRTAPPQGLYGFRGGQRYYFLNAVEELDEPGEYFVDAKARRVYFWPPSAENKEIVLSTLGQPFLKITGAARVRIDGLAMRYGRANGIEVLDSDDITLSDIDIQGVGNNGIVVRGGKNVIIEKCHIARTGDGGIELTGGDRKTLTPAGHTARDNHLHDFGEWSKTYNPAIKINGVGNRLQHNQIHDAPHAGILLTGNDHLIEYNHIHHLAKETGDVGAFYIGRDWTERGNAVRYNYIHHMGGVGSIGSMAVYLDDCSSGTQVYGNIFYKVQRAAFIGGGRDNVVENNLFVECATPVHVDSRGLKPQAVWQNMVYKTMRQRLEDVDAFAPPYITRYPELASLKPYYAKPGGVPPEGTRIRRNIAFGKGPWIRIHERAPEFVKDIGDNWFDESIGVADPANGDFTLKDPEKARQIGFTPIPFERIGPRK